MNGSPIGLLLAITYTVLVEHYINSPYLSDAINFTPEADIFDEKPEVVSSFNGEMVADLPLMDDLVVLMDDPDALMGIQHLKLEIPLLVQPFAIEKPALTIEKVL